MPVSLRFSLHATGAGAGRRWSAPHPRGPRRAVGGVLRSRYGQSHGRPAIVVCTSGTAAANFHPAVLEARHGRVPLVVCTADRRPSCGDTGAGQTIDQVGLFGTAPRWAFDPGPRTIGPGREPSGARSGPGRCWSRSDHRPVPCTSTSASGSHGADGGSGLGGGGPPDGEPWTRAISARRVPTMQPPRGWPKRYARSPWLVVAAWGRGDVTRGDAAFRRGGGLPVLLIRVGCAAAGRDLDLRPVVAQLHLGRRATARDGARVGAPLSGRAGPIGSTIPRSRPSPSGWWTPMAPGSIPTTLRLCRCESNPTHCYRSGRSVSKPAVRARDAVADHLAECGARGSHHRRCRTRRLDQPFEGRVARDSSPRSPKEPRWCGVEHAGS